MTVNEMYDQIRSAFEKLKGSEELMNEKVIIRADELPERQLMPEDYVPFKGKRAEYRLKAEFLGSAGEAYTEAPENFDGTLREALALKPTDRGMDARFLAALNAAMSHMGYCCGAWEDSLKAHEAYAEELYRYVTENYGKSRIVLVGYDGYIVKKFSESGMDFWTLDRDPDNISQKRFDQLVVNSARLNRESCFKWAKLMLVTSSALCNGTISQFIDKGPEILLYGITGAGASKFIDIPYFEVKR